MNYNSLYWCTIVIGLHLDFQTDTRDHFTDFFQNPLTRKRFLIMFRASSHRPFTGPHQQTGHLSSGAPPGQASGAMVLVHGRGASAASILSLADELHAEQIHFVAPQASRHTWYPYSFLAPAEQNEPGLSSGLQAIFDLVRDLEEKGLPENKIIITGFSQGACLATEFVARHPARYGGLAALSGGLIGDFVSAGNYTGSLAGTPCFFGCSDIDPHIPVERVHESADILERLGADVTKKIYPGMGHTVNQDEISHIIKLIQNVIDT